MPTVGLIGTLDTKGPDFAYLVNELKSHRVDVLLVDVGVAPPPDDAPPPDITADEVARAAGTSLAALREGNDRGAAIDAMAHGAAKVVAGLASDGTIHAVLSAGGSGGSSIAARAMAELPIGFPKLLVSTMASGDVSPYVGAKDVTIMYSVVDVAGINRISRRVLGNAAAAAAAMATHDAGYDDTGVDGRPLVAMSMFGVTTPAVQTAQQRLAELGYEPLVFHATGLGGKALEALAASGMLAGVFDLTTTELADDLVGGVLSAGPDRLTAAAAHGVPQVVAPGALDMVNFGPEDTVPERFDGRTFFVHNPTVTLMRTTVDEMAELGSRLGQKVAASTGPAEVYWPSGGVSALDEDGGAFADADANARCLRALTDALDGSVPLHVVDAHINDPEFALEMADRLHAMITERTTA